MNDVTRILSDLDRGNPRAADELLPLVYAELRKLAAHKLAHEAPGQTLQPTALVHEAYLRLVGNQNDQKTEFANRLHFLAAAAEAMRRILIDNARRKRSSKHGGDVKRDYLDAETVAAPDDPEDILALDGALTKLAATNEAAAKVVQLRFFAGLPLSEVAQLLSLSPRTADRLWAYARAWLFQELSGQG